MGAVEIRPARPDDAATISKVAEAAWWAVYPGILETDSIKSALSDHYDTAVLRTALEERDDLLFLVAERSGDNPGDGSPDDPPSDIVGFATAQQTWADEVAIHTLYVHPDQWDEGVGTALLEAVAESAHAAGVDRLRCTVISGNHVGRAFLESRDFERVETVTAEVGDETLPEDAFERDL